MSAPTFKIPFSKKMKKFAFLIDNHSHSCIIVIENDYQYQMRHPPTFSFLLYWSFSYPLLYMPVNTDVMEYT
ncbi:Uncharacterised protein [Staphylococcus piscifermentans]|nr:Uncharacterised protein [Staphylococcus piscifermentans]